MFRAAIFVHSGVNSATSVQFEPKNAPTKWV